MPEYVTVKGTDRLRRKTHPQTRVAKPRVINKKYASRLQQRLSVYIGRPSRWGNPYPMTREAKRDEVCDKYELHIAARLVNGDIADADFREFDGKNLMCFCAPKRCHGDTVLALYNMNHEERLEWARSRVGRSTDQT